MSGHRPSVVSLGVPEPDGGARVVPVGRDEVLLQPEPRPLVAPPGGRVVSVHVLSVACHVSVQAQVINILEPKQIVSKSIYCLSHFNSLLLRAGVKTHAEVILM